MKKTLLTFAAILCACLMNAQPIPSEVAEPGAKGLLPEPNEMSPARDRELPILTLSDVGFSPLIINGIVDIEANLKFPMVEEVGCEYYTLQHRVHGTGTWETMREGEETKIIGNRSIGVSPEIYAITDYRLVLHGGGLDGYVSNTVTAKPISVISRYTSWNESPMVEHCMVGIPVGSGFSVSAETYNSGDIKKYATEENPEYFSYQWYRRNPYNADMEPISGASNSIYTPTTDDLGYELVLQVGGDKQHLDFSLYHAFAGVVCVPVQASIEYLGSDGFILNTDYVIPEPQKMFVLGESWMEDAPTLNPNCISETAPGQYVFRMTEEEYNYSVYELANPAYFLTFIYKFEGAEEGEEELWYREVQIMSDRYKGQLSVKALQGGTAVPAIIDVIGKNIDGKWDVVASQEVNAETGEAVFQQDWEADTDDRIFFGEYYVKARNTASTMETFYPSTPLWTSASLVDIVSENMWEPKQVEINLLTMPAPLAGTGLIEGNINTGLASESQRKAPAQDGITVYLLDDANSIVAQTTTDYNGNFRFENVPFGSYTVLPNIAGYTVVAPTEVTLTAANPSVSDVFYSVSDDEVIPTGICKPAHADTNIESIWSLSGIQKQTRGLNIIRMSDGSIRKIISK